MFSAKFIITVFSTFVAVSATPGAEALGLQRKQASPTITLCIGSISPPTGCITILVVSGSCMNLSGGLSPLNKQISGVQVPFVCTFFHDEVILQCSEIDLGSIFYALAWLYSSLQYESNQIAHVCSLMTLQIKFDQKASEHKTNWKPKMNLKRPYQQFTKKAMKAPPALARAIATSLNLFTTDEHLQVDIQHALDNSSAPAAEAEPANRKFAAGKDVLSTLRFKRQRVAQTGAGKTTSPAPVSDSDSDDEVQEILRNATPVAAPEIIAQAAAPARATFAAVTAIPYATPIAQAPIGPVTPVAIAIPVVANQAFTPYRNHTATSTELASARVGSSCSNNEPGSGAVHSLERLYAYISGGNQVAPALVAGLFCDLVAEEAPGSAATLQMGPSNAVNPPRGVMASPAAWLIRGTDIGDTDHLSDLAVLAQEGRALFILDYALAMPCFLVNLVNLSHQNTPAGLAVLQQEIHATFMDNSHIWQHNTTYRD
ncbi:hypothetical protein C8J56DRAFT_889497 [Mycena floridula]|nr:hypothetical protein C8J56DRAFT_889497 [Mycena floridula]